MSVLTTPDPEVGGTSKLQRRVRLVIGQALTAMSLAGWALAHAQVSSALRDGVGSATSEQWRAAASVLSAGMLCRQPLAHTDDVRAVFHLTNDAYDGEHPLPMPITVFGYPTNVLTIVDGWQYEPISYSVDLDVSLAAIAKAAQLVPQRGTLSTYGRHVPGGGHLVARQLDPGRVRLTCSWPEPGSPR